MKKYLEYLNNGVTKMILFKYANNYYRYNPVKQRFLSYAKQPGRSGSIGSWFNCGEEQVESLKEVISTNNYQLCNFIPGIEQKFTNLKTKKEN